MLSPPSLSKTGDISTRVCNPDLGLGLGLSLHKAAHLALYIHHGCRSGARQGGLVLSRGDFGPVGRGGLRVWRALGRGVAPLPIGVSSLSAR